MSARMYAFSAAALAAVMATPAMAQGTEPWNLNERNAYVMDMQGKMWSTRMTTAAWNTAVNNARAVPRGTVFFMNNRRLYMTSRGMFDRAGNYMVGGA